jgi:hypothetical protein
MQKTYIAIIAMQEHVGKFHTSAHLHLHDFDVIPTNRTKSSTYISLHDFGVAVCNIRAKQKTEQFQLLAFLARSVQNVFVRPALQPIARKGVWL